MLGSHKCFVSIFFISYTNSKMKNYVGEAYDYFIHNIITQIYHFLKLLVKIMETGL